MADKKYKDVPRIKAVAQYEQLFKSEFASILKVAVKNITNKISEGS